MAARAEADASALTARAEAEAASITTVAKAEAAAALDQANATAAKLIEDARAEARRTKDEEHLRAEREVHELFARREMLVSDVDALESFVTAERERLRAASASLLQLAEAPSGGLGAVDRPALSAVAETVAETLPAPTVERGPASVNGVTDAELMPPPVPEPMITGQIPIVGAQPLVSPMPSSNEEARSMWHEAELADDAAAAADETVPMDATPHVSLPVEVEVVAGQIALDDESTPAEGSASAATSCTERQMLNPPWQFATIVCRQRRRRGHHLRAFGRTVVGALGRLSRTERVQPVIAGASEWLRGCGPGQAGWYRGRRLVPVHVPSQSNEPGVPHELPRRRTATQLPRLEREVLAFWEGDHTFEASIAARADADEYVFYDGPPFANGLPHYGHLLTGFVKDAVPRYRTMRGQKVDRRFGWDCHGLPAEVVVEKELGISGHPGDHQVRHRQVQRRLPHERAALHRRLAPLRHPPGPLGRLRATTTRPSTSRTWRASCGRSRPCGTRA